MHRVRRFRDFETFKVSGISLTARATRSKDYFVTSEANSHIVVVFIEVSRHVTYFTVMRLQNLGRDPVAESRKGDGRDTYECNTNIHAMPRFS